MNKNINNNLKGLEIVFGFFGLFVFAPIASMNYIGGEKKQRILDMCIIDSNQSFWQSVKSFFYGIYLDYLHFMFSIPSNFIYLITIIIGLSFLLLHYFLIDSNMKNSNKKIISYLLITIPVIIFLIGCSSRNSITLNLSDLEKLSSMTLDEKKEFLVKNGFEYWREKNNGNSISFDYGKEKVVEGDNYMYNEMVVIESAENRIIYSFYSSKSFLKLKEAIKSDKSGYSKLQVRDSEVNLVAELGDGYTKKPFTVFFNELRDGIDKTRYNILLISGELE